ncbi:MAG TPA: hypothetical protein VMV20_02130 [Chitinophagaceae bacterium]|nr:hypothetical protein [Chitinophagaceae bacterium]
MKMLLICSLLLVPSLLALGQQPARVKTGTHHVAYVCPKCFTSYSHPGECKKDQEDLVKMGDYFCPQCLMDEGNKPGHCNMDGTTLVQMNTSYIKAHKPRS